MTDWDWTTPADPRNITTFLQKHPDVRELAFTRPTLAHRLALPENAPVQMSYAAFAREYRQTVELAWFACCALLRSDVSPEERIPVSRRITHGVHEVTFTLDSATIDILRNLDWLTIHRAMIVPDVLAAVFSDFHREQLGPFEIALGSKDALSLAANSEVTIVAVSNADFVRGQKLLETVQAESARGAYYRLKSADNDGEEQFLPDYGFSLGYPGKTFKFREYVDAPLPSECGEELITSYLCFPDFTETSRGGLVLAMERPDSPACRERPALQLEYPVEDPLPQAIWWYNHHDCYECSKRTKKKCPDHHFDTDEAVTWKKWSVLPYVDAKNKQLSGLPHGFDHALLLATGVAFFDADLLGLFLSVFIKKGSKAPDKWDERLSAFMASLRAHIGHIRFQMMESLATEIAREFHDQRTRHSEMLRLLNQPIENLRQRVLGAIDDARRITQIVQGPQMVPFVKSALVASYFEEGRIERIGTTDYTIAHDPGRYTMLHEQCAVFAAVTIKLFGEDWRNEETTLDLFRRASLLLTRTSGPDERLCRICQVLTGLEKEDLRSLEDRLEEKQVDTDRRLGAALQRLKDVLHTPGKQDADKYPWTPLFLVLFGDPAEKNRQVLIRLGTGEAKRLGTLPEAMDWIKARGKGNFLDLPLPVPRYDMLLTFLANVIAFDRSDRQTTLYKPVIRLSKGQTARAPCSIEITFGNPIREKEALRLAMQNAHQARGWPTYVGNLHGPFLAWAAECAHEGKLVTGDDETGDDELFAVTYRRVRSSIRFGDDKVLTIRFEPSQ